MTININTFGEFSRSYSTQKCGKMWKNVEKCGKMWKNVDKMWIKCG